MPRLQFLANMNISPLSVEQLRQAGWEIIRVSDVLSASSKDKDILEYARIHNKILITQDLDFSLLLALGGYHKPSVISLRLENPSPDSVSRRLLEIVTVMESELDSGAVVSVGEVSVRYQILPIKFD